jgi:hypothetical protein
LPNNLPRARLNKMLRLKARVRIKINLQRRAKKKRKIFFLK